MVSGQENVQARSRRNVENVQDEHEHKKPCLYPLNSMFAWLKVWILRLISIFPCE